MILLQICLINMPSLNGKGEQKILSVLYTDIHDFSTHAASMQAEALIKNINDIIPVTQSVVEYGGTIDRYIGQAMQAFWNAPHDDKDRARHAIQAALDIQDVIGQINTDFGSQGP